jgi:hypothetical protein
MKVVTAVAMAVSFGLGLSDANAQSVPRYKEAASVIGPRGVLTDMQTLNSSLAFLLTAADNIEPAHRSEVEQLKARYEKLQARYQSAPMSQAWAMAAPQVGVGQSAANDALRQLQARFKREYSDGYVFSHRYQCHQPNNGKLRSDYVESLNAAFRAARKSMYYLETLLPKSKDSGALLMTEAKLQQIEGPNILCIKFEGGELVEQTPAPAVVKNEKIRVAPYSASRNPQHEMTCQLLDDPAIPPQPPVKCVFNYKQKS